MSFRGEMDHCDSDPISYDEALDRVVQIARTIPKRHVQSASDDCRSCDGPKTAESLNLLDAVGKRSMSTLHAPHSTPLTDTSAMDGYAVDASATIDASSENPVRLRIVDSIAAGDAPHQDLFVEGMTGPSHESCVEIMTGACFPELMMPSLSSAVKVEDVIVRQMYLEGTLCRYIELRRPVKEFQNRRLAGSDFKEGDIIVKRGTIIEPKHIAALASLGYTRIEVTTDVFKQSSHAVSVRSGPSLTAGIISTGSEIVSQIDEGKDQGQANSKTKQMIPDSNGPYLVSTLRALCPWTVVKYIGVATDNAEELATMLRKAIFEDGFDVIITSGGVSKGRHDLVRHVVQSMLDGRIVFHGVKIRPGAPVLFASFDHSNGSGCMSSGRKTVLFGAPGNPLAAAIALRFFAVPYVLEVNSRNTMKQQGLLNYAQVSNSTVCALPRDRMEVAASDVKRLRTKPADKTVFWLGRQQQTFTGHVELIADQASYKLRGLLGADCWVIVPAGVSEVFSGDRLVTTCL